MGTSARLATVAASALAARARHRPLAEDLVLYESFAGKGMLCNPEAIFQSLLADPEYAHLRHVWALDDPAAHPDLVAAFADDRRVTFVRRRSTRYYALLGTAKYLINNATFPVHFARRDGQVYLNTWHGTPIKAMGYDVPGGAPLTPNVVRNLVAADYLLAPNDATARMYLDSYRARGLFRGAFVTAGTPRIDRQFDVRGAAATRARLPGTDGTRVVLYAPTWRGSFDRPDTDLVSLRRDVARIASALDEGSRLLVRLHQQVAAGLRDDDGLRDFLVPPDLPANRVLAVTDVLVTDYSSIAVDFLATGRPVLFYVPDVDDYRAQRGLSWSRGDWPGPVSSDVEDLVQQLRDVGSGRDGDPVAAHAVAYRRARQRYCVHEDGAATRRVIDAVFRGSPDAVVRPADDGRTRLLLYIGRLAPNGITSSALSLLRNIDHERYDVSVTYQRPTTEAARRTEALLAEGTRLLPRLGGGTWVKLRETPRGIPGPRRRRASLPARRAARMRDEWTRCFGASRFDHVIDFSGYSAFFSRLLQQRDAGNLTVWLHNDVGAELAVAARDRQLRQQLAVVRAGYPQADRLVSVCASLADVNHRTLVDEVPDGAFAVAENTVDGGRVEELGRAAVPDGLGTLFGPELVTFVSVGRLSAQKNHARLIDAFAAVHAERPDTRLVLVGDGPLRNDLESAVRAAGLGSQVILAGDLTNPYPVMAAADCCVCSSDYEGQPIVLFEARVLGRPVVSTRFDTVHDALPDGAGRIVDRSAAALADGMRAFLRGEVHATPFDYDAHNRRALAQFAAGIGDVPAPHRTEVAGRAGRPDALRR